MDTIEFLTQLFAYAEGNSYLWTLPDKRTYCHPCDAAGEMVQQAALCNSQYKDVFFSPGLTEKQPGQYERPKNTDIIGIPALWADIDISDAAHKAANLPPDVPSARELLPGAIDPSIIVYSGHGIHVYYLLKEMMDTRTSQEQQAAEDLLRRLQGMIQTNAAAHGWHVDSVPDICRVLRMPGTQNWKNGQENPATCTVIEYDTARRYDPQDFDILPPVEERLDSGRRSKFERRETDGPAKYMLDNCMFLQDWQQNFKALPEPIWKAACTNLIRGIGGEDIILAAAKEWLGEKYNEGDTLKKLQHYLNGCTPQTCQYIQNELGFKRCYQCTVKAPCAWSVGKVPQALAKVRQITLPDVENTLNEETLGALAILKQYDSLEYAKFEERCKGRVNLNNLKHEVKLAKAKAAGLSVVDGAGAMLQPGQTLGDLTTQQFVADTPLNLRIPPNFTYGNDGIHECRQSGENLVRHLASGVPVVISQRIYNLDTEMEKVRLSFKYFGRWRHVVCKRSEIFSSRAIVGLTDLGLNASSETAKYLVKYLQSLEAVNPEIPLAHAVSKIGWRDGTLTDFVIPSHTQYYIDMDDDGEVSGAFGQCGTFDEWKRMAIEVRRYPFARFVLAASFAAPLLKIFKNRNFMIYFWGTSGGGKTASQIFSLSPWGSPKHMMKSFYATQNGIEKVLAFSNDFPTVINEKQVMGGHDKQGALEQIVYMLEGGHGKVRSGKSGMQRTSTWRSIGMASGEEPLSKESSVQGVKTRLLELNVYPVMEDAAAKKVYAHVEENHGQAGPFFVERLIQDAGNDYRDIHNARDALVTVLHRDFPEHFSIHIDNVALVAIADYLVSCWIFGATPAEAQQEAYDLACQIMQELPTEGEISDVERGWNFVQTWLESNSARFDDGTASYRKLTPEYGYIENRVTSIYPEYLVEALNNMGFSADKLLKEFAENGRIVSTVEGATQKRRFRVKVRHNGKALRVIRIPVVG